MTEIEWRMLRDRCRMQGDENERLLQALTILGRKRELPKVESGSATRHTFTSPIHSDRNPDPGRYAE